MMTRKSISLILLAIISVMMMLLSLLAFITLSADDRAPLPETDHKRIIEAIIDGLILEGETTSPQTIVCQPSTVQWVCTGLVTHSGAQYTATVELEHLGDQMLILPATLSITKEPRLKEADLL